MVDGSGGVEYHPLPSDDPRNRQPTIDRAREVLGWQPRIELTAGLERTIDYFRQHLAEHPIC
jgi:nucleoside-diphosphate-sugar epimerase